MVKKLTLLSPKFSLCINKKQSDEINGKNLLTLGKGCLQRQ